VSGAALGWAKAQRAPSVIAKAVLVCLADYADQEHKAWPSVPVIAAEVQVSERTVQRALRLLETDGLIETLPWDRKDGGRTANRYLLAIPPGDRLSPAPRQDVTPPVTLLSPATEPPIEPTHPDGCVSAHTPVFGFEAWWQAYPDAVDEPAARKAYAAAARKIGPNADAELMAGLDRSKASARWADKTYTRLNPANWLDRERWKDRDPAAPSTAPPRLVMVAPTPEQLAARVALLESLN
jgi:hypothetical protein